MLGDDKGWQKIEYLSDYVAFDLETTGTSCTKDKVVEISAIKVIEGKITDEFSTLVNPECKIPVNASRINGITDDMVKDAPVFKEALAIFLRFVGNLVLVGHNIHSFDMKFINRDCEEYFGLVPGNDCIDTLTMARICLPELNHHSLTDIAEFYGISTEGAHRALSDCRMNQAIYEEMGKCLHDKMLNIRQCPTCGNILVRRSRKYGEFFGCAGYPKCRYTEDA